MKKKLNSLWFLNFILICFSCKTSDNIYPLSKCKLIKVILSLKNNPASSNPLDYIAELKYNNDGKLISHKVNFFSPAIPPLSTAGSFIPSNSDSIVYEKKDFYRIFHFESAFSSSENYEKENFLINGKVILSKKKFPKRNLSNFEAESYMITESYNYNSSNVLVSSIAKSVTYRYKATSFNSSNSLPFDSTFTRVDSTFYTFEKNNLVSQVVKSYSIYSIKPSITEYSYTYDDKINPYYQLPISYIGLSLSENNFVTATTKYKSGTSIGESLSKQTYLYNSEGYPITYSFGSTQIYDFVYDCK